LAPKKACIPVQPSRPIGEEDVVERTISVHENLLALAANLFKLWHEPFEIARWKGEHKPVAGPI
jgi:hypothetical protein